jgi:Ser/Thr protein kinase RdoA (MazF antagonist)
MEKQIKDRYSQKILHEALQRYGIHEDQVRMLGGFESFIYEFEQDAQAYILRIGHSMRRDEHLVLGEVDWINFLAEGGASVAKAVPSRNGDLVEGINDGEGEYFIATVFKKAMGAPPWEIGWTETSYETYGQLLGRIHALSREYTPSNPDWVRPHWNDPIMLGEEISFIPSSDGTILERFHALIEHLESLPKDNRSYGLIHQDPHAGNLFIDDDGVITLFDFDDCTYSWFIHDIAMVVFYKVMGAEEVPEFMRKFTIPFLRGYQREVDLEPWWLKEIPHFLKLREIELYAVIHRSFDVQNLDDPWCARYMDGRKGKLEDGVPYIDFDFDTLNHMLVESD